MTKSTTKALNREILRLITISQKGGHPRWAIEHGGQRFSKPFPTTPRDSNWLKNAIKDIGNALRSHSLLMEERPS
ncbi:MAG: hypothetical protein GDA52_05750 [Rhodobacteraceae bacterium]|nr:hypothetical protein [Paracoccaceae bacterium]